MDQWLVHGIPDPEFNTGVSHSLWTCILTRNFSKHLRSNEHAALRKLFKESVGIWNVEP